MNDLERKIANLHRPQPTPQFDERMAAIFDCPPVRTIRSRFQIFVTVSAVVALAVVAIPRKPAEQPALDAAWQSPVDEDRGEEKVVNIPNPQVVIVVLPESSSLFMPQPAAARLWGSDQLSWRVVTTDSVNLPM